MRAKGVKCEKQQLVPPRCGGLAALEDETSSLSAYSSPSTLPSRWYLWLCWAFTRWCADRAGDGAVALGPGAAGRVQIVRVVLALGHGDAHVLLEGGGAGRRGLRAHGVLVGEGRHGDLVVVVDLGLVGGVAVDDLDIKGQGDLGWPFHDPVPSAVGARARHFGWEKIWFGENLVQFEQYLPLLNP